MFPSYLGGFCFLFFFFLLIYMYTFNWFYSRCDIITNNDYTPRAVSALSICKPPNVGCWQCSVLPIITVSGKALEMEDLICSPDSRANKLCALRKASCILCPLVSSSVKCKDWNLWAQNCLSSYKILHFVLKY